MSNSVMPARLETARRKPAWLGLLRWIGLTLILKVLAGILLQYRDYFPPNFDAAFLIGRRAFFWGVYAVAFYIHLLVAPVVLLLGLWQLFSGTTSVAGVSRRMRWHRWAGRLQGVLILTALVPSSLVLASRSFGGPIAGLGFAALAISTTVCTLALVFAAWAGNYRAHERWAKRCMVLLISPLVLRLISGGLIVTGLESAAAYQANAWLSWLAPLALYEATRRCWPRLAIPFWLGSKGQQQAEAS